MNNKTNNNIINTTETNTDNNVQTTNIETPIENNIETQNTNIESNNNIHNQDNSELKKDIRFEFILVGAFILVTLLMPYVLYGLLGDNTGIDGLGNALALAIIYRIAQMIIAAILFIGLPIKNLKKHKETLKRIEKHKRNRYMAVIVLPIIFALTIIFQVPLSNLKYNLKYETGANAYTVSEEKYKSPSDLKSELEGRGLLYDVKNEVNYLNSNYSNYSSSFSDYFYTEGRITTIPFNLDYYTDNNDYSNIISFDALEKYPGYVYSAILYYDINTDELKYTPIFKSSKSTYLSGEYPYMNDYYIGIEFIYVDNDFYAILGPSSSYYANKSSKDLNNKPFTMILSEKDKITTYYKGKYYPNGGIENQGNEFKFTPNTNKPLVYSLFNIKKVDKLDITTINKLAEELKDGVLKESIDNYKKSNKTKKDEKRGYSEETIDKKDEYTLSVENQDKQFNFIYTYKENTASKYKYSYILVIESPTDYNSDKKEYVVGVGNTKEEAKNMYLNSNIKYDSSLIKVIKENTAFGVDYLLYLIPTYEVNRNSEGYITYPTVYSPIGGKLNEYKTSYTLNGYLLPNDPNLGFTKESIESTYATIRVEDYAFYYIKEVKCNNGVGRGDIIKAFINNQKIQTLVYKTGVEYTLTGTLCK